ncbi:MAG: GTPase Era [Myxococcales bacterium]|nr:GTPase Era [Myxococcales bacterium]
MRFGTVALVGRTNVGKSTLLNAALGEPLAITSPLPQTTRDALLGVVRRGAAQIAFLDTPGLHRPRTELGRRMNAAAYESARSADLVVMMTDVWTKPPKEQRALPGGGPLDNPWLRPGDREVLETLAGFAPGPRILLVNKVDLLRDKTQLLPQLDAYAKAQEFEAFIPVSVRRNDGVDAALDEIARLLPEGPAGFDEDTLTNRPVLFFVREYVREAILNQFEREVPHAVAVSIDAAEESAQLLSLAATIHVEKVGQRKILVGHGGEQIKAIGIAARQRIESLVDKQVHLKLFVRVTPHWKDMPRQLSEMGYDPAQGIVAPEVLRGEEPDAPETDPS